VLIAKLANKLEVIERFDVAIESSVRFPAIAGHRSTQLIWFGGSMLGDRLQHAAPRNGKLPLAAIVLLDTDDASAAVSSRANSLGHIGWAAHIR
jgi:hypothetical protein